MSINNNKENAKMKKLRISNVWLNVEEEKQGIYGDWYPVLVLSPGQADKFYNITFATEKKTKSNAICWFDKKQYEIINYTTWRGFMNYIKFYNGDRNIKIDVYSKEF